MKWCAFDCEGRVDSVGVTAVSAYSDKGPFYTESWQEGIHYLQEMAKNGYTLCAHNAEYDIEVLLWQYGERCRIVYTNGRFNRGEWEHTKGKKRTQIWDTLRLSNGLTLAALGKALNLPKYETPQQLLNIDPSRYRWQCDTHGAWECIQCYAVRDAEICYEYMRSYESFLGNYSVKPKRTTGSAAVALWRSLDTPQPCYLRSNEQREFAQSGYLGGRTEVFKYGKIGKLYTADVKSMYPSVMLTVPMPDPQYTNIIETEHMGMHLLNTMGMSECTVYVPQMHVPPLPVVSDKKLYFPVGLFRGTWTHLELQAAIDRGAEVLKIHRTMYATRTLQPFTQYILTLMELRNHYLKIGDARQFTVKVILNALYGRLGLGKEQEQTNHELIPNGMGSKDYRGSHIFYVGNRAFARRSHKREIASPWSNTLWAATITAAARVKLLGFLEMQHENLVYCDTDSVFSTAPICGTSEGLGMLQSDGEWEDALMLAPKMYRLIASDGTQKTKAKGVPQRVADKFIDDSIAEYEQVIKPRSSARRKLPAGTWVLTRKEWRHTPAKRHVLDPSWMIKRDHYSDTNPVAFELSSAFSSSTADSVCGPITADIASW